MNQDIFIIKGLANWIMLGITILWELSGSDIFGKSQNCFEHFNYTLVVHYIFMFYS